MAVHGDGLLAWMLQHTAEEAISTGE